MSPFNHAVPPTVWRATRLMVSCLCASLVLAAKAPRPAAQAHGTIDFNRDIRPIFSENCYACHGPDRNRRKAGLRLDQKEAAFAKLESGKYALIPGDPGRSELTARVLTENEDDRMPPPKTGKKLTPAQTALLSRWVAEGARWKEHWSYLPPERPPLPETKNKTWPRNPIDQFVLERLEKEGLQPASEADKPSLIRRASLDLTGLPPTLEEVDGFLADRSAQAYDKLVDRLMASKHFGERMALNWLDLARYADTSGYHFDGVRFMWLWRDWVINAFNQNLAFDRFTIEQLAGDQLPNATTAQRVASGFNRNNMTNDEGGADPDEYLNKYVVDRVNTTGTVWLGLTVGCAECHDHKYDRLTQKEFYQLYAFFNSVPEKGLDRIRTDNPPPRLPVSTPEQSQQMVERDFELRDTEKTLADRSNELGETQEKWERETQGKPPAPLRTEGLLALVSLDSSLTIASPGATNPPAPQPKLVGAEQPTFGDGRSAKALVLDGKLSVDLGQLVEFDSTNAFSYGAWVKLQKENGCVLSKMEADPSYRGFDLLASDLHFEVHLVNAWPTNAIKVRTKDAFAKGQWLHVMATYDGLGKAAGVKIYVDGKLRELELQKDLLTASITTSEPLRIGARSNQPSLAGSLNDLRLYERALPREDVHALIFAELLPIVVKTGGQRTQEQQDDLRRFYRENYAIDFIRSEEALAKAKKAKEDLVKTIPTTMVMADLDPPRDTFVLVRGDFRTKGEQVHPGVPSFLPSLPDGQAATRLSLAKWVVATNNPLTARVTVNREWQHFFGSGLVKTVSDFGSQGEWPSHPELLDWLACQFRDGGQVQQRGGTDARTTPRSIGAWDVKELVRLLVTSAAYRQSAVTTRQKLERDPENRLLARGPRHRLDAELIRDNALAISGLLNRKIGGPSIKPYQPPNIWDGTDAEYVQDHGADLYRRGMYVFWRRSAHYPSFSTFDAPNREVCTFLRQRTQTPLQSLVLMNDPVYVEAARALAQRLVKEVPGDVQKRLARGFRLSLARTPTTAEMGILTRAYEQQLATFKTNQEAVEALRHVGESTSPDVEATAEFAALTSVASLLLNLNETISN